jgi:site-specific DNA-methyltransferase (adenine-specific)
MKKEITDNYSLLLGDNIQSMKTMEDNSIDSVVTDPPYGLTSIVKRFGKSNSKDAQYGTDGVFKRSSKGFMGKEWDSDVPSVEFWKEVYRILKPGGHILSFGGTRTFHKMATNIDNAGFEIVDQLQWIYLQGFPKSHNIGKAIDKIQGDKRTASGKKLSRITRSITKNDWGAGQNDVETKKENSKWEEWGTSLKPANEPICLARKPISEKTIAKNVLKWGTGGINIGDSRIPYENCDDENHQENIRKGKGTFFGGNGISKDEETKPKGRFPANIMLDDDIDVYWKRYFYCPKVSKKERDMGLDDFDDKAQRTTNGGSRDFNARCANCGKKFIGSPNSICSCDNPITDNQVFKKKNNHPTVKPIQLMSYLVKLITPIGGTVLDPFMGSGSGGISSLLEGFKFVGMEQDPEYFEIAKERIKNYESYREILVKKQLPNKHQYDPNEKGSNKNPVITFWLDQAV